MNLIESYNLAAYEISHLGIAIGLFQGSFQKWIFIQKSGALHNLNFEVDENFNEESEVVDV